VEAYVAVSLSSYAPDVVRKFHERMAMLDEVLSCASTTGDLDYLLRIVVRDLRAYSHLMNTELLGHGDVASVRTSVVLDRIKHTTALPITD
jgi:Lrp/AsnC family leucine-responsive transcriptional regulator